jgi:hypothetical protein
MDKVFVNDDIFQSDGDYVIGGFIAHKEDDFNLGDFKAKFTERVAAMIDDYLQRAMIYNQELGYEDPYEQAKSDLALVISDNLHIETPYTDKETLAKTIINSIYAQKWVLEIAENVRAFNLDAPLSQGKFRGIYNHALTMDTSSPAYMNAEYFTEESTLEAMIEQLSIIEL